MKKIVAISGKTGSGKDTVADRLVDEFGFVKVALSDPIKRYAKAVFRFTDAQLWGERPLRNAVDARFGHYDPDNPSDAWEATFSRMHKTKGLFASELFPDDSLLRATAVDTLEEWLREFAESGEPVTPRVVLQLLGTEWGRSLDKSVWVNYAVRVCNSLLGGGSTYSPSIGLVPSNRVSTPAGIVIPDVRFTNELETFKMKSVFLVKIDRPATDIEAHHVGIQNHASEVEQDSFDVGLFNYSIRNDQSLSELFQAIDVVGFMITTGRSYEETRL